ncbi:MAG: hypothetical protein NTV52_01360 [Acidobacteria bacterium]|nr:hypothetical protein [Acidobacteriota bacterium]
MIVNTNGGVLRTPLSGGEAIRLAAVPVPPETACTVGTNCLSLRDGTYLPETFGPLAGKLLVVGGVATTNTPAHASLVDEGLGATAYATQNSSLWSAAVVANGFGPYSGGVLVVNQGSGQELRNGGVDFFAPDGTVQLMVPLPDTEVPYGAAIAPWGFGDVAGHLLVSDARSGRIYKVDPFGNVNLFATVPLAPTQAGLRQVAFAPQGWGKYTRHLFVSIATGEVAVLNGFGTVVAKIQGLGSPRALRFAELDGKPSLLIAETNASQLIYRVGPENLVPVP